MDGTGQWSHPTDGFDALNDPWHRAAQLGHSSLGCGTLGRAAHPWHRHPLTEALAALGGQREEACRGERMQG